MRLKLVAPAGGTAEADEMPEQAIIRELAEELQIKVNPGRHLYKVPLPDEEGIDYGILTDLSPVRHTWVEIRW